MTTQKNFVLASVLIFAMSGCANLKQRTADVKAHVVDIPKAIWGSSTRAIEEARPEAISRSFTCSYEDCFNAVLGLGEAWKEPKAVEERENTVLTDMPLPDPGQNQPTDTAGQTEVSIVKSLPFNVFFFDRVKRHIIVINVPGSVDSTEVGIFFDDAPQGVKIDIASLSSHAKRNVAASVFKELESKFPTEAK